eukprot:5644597-Pleurochrysis_carterae.AAC.3
MSACMSRPAYDGLYCVVFCGWRVAFASVQAAQPSNRPWASEAGASAVMDGRARRRVDPHGGERGCKSWLLRAT